MNSSRETSQSRYPFSALGIIIGSWLLLAMSGLGGTTEGNDGKTPPLHENIALGKRYTLWPAPNYPYCTDPEDTTQLTDGKYSDPAKGIFWTQKSTVGWSNQRPPVVITLDLASHYAIRGLSYNTASGGGDVEWPVSIEVLVSLDNREYHYVGDLVALSKVKLPEGSNVVHRFQTDRLETHGRYVKLIVHPGGRLRYSFVDEIEVFRGEEAWKQVALPGEAIRYPKDYPSPFLKSAVFIWTDDPFNTAIGRRLDLDLEAARSMVMTAGLNNELKDRLVAEADDLQQAIQKLPRYEAKDFRAIFPLNEVQARIYALHGSVREAQGRPPLVAWKANPWDFLQPVDLPSKPPASRIKISAMRGETRAAALNLTNCTGQNQSVHLTFEGLPDGTMPPYVTVREVAWTDTFQGTPIAAALPLAERDEQGWKISIPAGLTRQVWFEVQPVDLASVKHDGRILIKIPSRKPLKVPFAVRVFDLDFPKTPALDVSGFDYSNVDYYGVSDQNRDKLIAHLRERYVDSTWETSASMPYGEFNADGTFKTEPNASLFDTWVKRWPNARRYLVYSYVNSAGGDEGKIDGTAPDDPLFAKKVATWIHFWVEHARKRGIAPNQLYLNLVDEPNHNDHDRVIIAWARAIKSAEPAVAIWVDPNYADPTKALPGLWPAADVLCLNWSQWLSGGEEFRGFYVKQKQAGRRLDLYSCGGAKLLDPYSYYRLQAWACFDAGAESSLFWAFGDAGGRGGSSWNEYALKYAPYSPLFIAPDSVTPGKHMEAIREGVEDFEYLVMLRDRIEQLTQTGSPHTLLSQARSRLGNATRRALKNLDGSRASSQGGEDSSIMETQALQAAQLYNWKDPKDRSNADTVRIEIGEILEKLK